ncbi:MAG: hypothetical protein LBR73_01965 [Oscillospiraceae bacterium]|jgi:uncharacterized protein YgfB (UPF0149 family)|nr:hypothetical protein [Oscillospiraceae bacterium]
MFEAIFGWADGIIEWVADFLQGLFDALASFLPQVNWDFVPEVIQTLRDLTGAAV